MEFKPFGASHGVRELLLCLRDQATDVRIITIGVMVEQYQSLHASFLGDAYSLLP